MSNASTKETPARCNATTAEGRVGRFAGEVDNIGNCNLVDAAKAAELDKNNDTTGGSGKETVKGFARRGATTVIVMLP